MIVEVVADQFPRRAYICGPPTMVEDVQGWLGELGSIQPTCGSRSTTDDWRQPFLDGELPVSRSRHFPPLIIVPSGQSDWCTFFNGQVRELAYLHSRDVTYATFCEGLYDESVRYRDFMGWDVPWYSARDSAQQLLAGRGFGLNVNYARDGERVFETYWTTGRGAEVMAPSYGLLDMTVYGRQEPWEDSPADWPQSFVVDGDQFRTNGRPSSQWSRLAQGRSDDLSSTTKRHQ